MLLTPGTRLGHYEILSRLGTGGMGEVYCARDLRLDRKVAIKILTERLAEDANALRRFEKEAKAVASLSHPNILDIHDFGTENGLSYAVTELLEGQSLRKRISQSPFPWRKAIEVATAVADGLAAAHSKGVIHRDLKPENIFLTTDGRVKILDFGLARLKPQVSEQDLTEAVTVSKLTETGVIMGTLAYMSPEQVRGEAVDERSDIFSFSCMLYEMIAGRRPFSGGTASEVTAAILRDDPLSLAEVPPELNQILHHCLEKDREQRLQSARDLAMALRDLLSASHLSQPAAAIAPRRRLITTRRMIVTMFAITILIVGLNIYLNRQKPLAPVTKKFESLAVLPLANLSGDATQEYFADGMTEALITDLAKIRALKVISRTSVMGFKNTKTPIREIARQLGVDAIVEGSVIRSKDRVRISAQLIDATTDTHLWAENYERDLSDVLRLQSEVAQAIAREVKTTLTPRETERITATRKVDPQAHEAYLRGRQQWQMRTRESLEKAEKYFQQAITKDPGFARPYAGLADTYTSLAGLFRPTSETYPKARKAALKALEVDPTLGEAHTTLGRILEEHDYDFRAAEQEYQRGIELSPGYATAHQWYGIYLAEMERVDQALAEIRKAVELDPLAPRIRVGLGLILWIARRYDQGIQEMQQAVELQPEDSHSHNYLGINLLFKGKNESAIEQIELANRLEPNNPDLLAWLAYAYAVSGKKGEARKIIQSQKIFPFALAVCYVGLQDKEKALALLEQAYEERHPSPVFLKAHRALDPLRSEPRFQALLRRMNFPQQ